ncbi:MAG: hypothetical protein MUD00_02575 [Candidatus Pacebacteria bacterium]|nr:hypothetical protein [Candidatus Paceibacterota bacterium]
MSSSSFTVLPATNITATGVDLSVSYTIGHADANAGGVDVKFVYDTTPSINYVSSPATAFTLLASGSGGSGTHTMNVAGLTPNTTYYYRILGNGASVSYVGNTVVSFTTLPANNSTGASTFTINPATAVTQATAQLNLTYAIAPADALNGGVDVKFVYDTTPSINYVSSPATAFTLLASGSGTTLANSVQAPIVSTVTAGNIANTQAQLNGTYNANGTASTIWFEYGPTVALGQSTSIQNVAANTSGNFNNTITGLAANSTYYFRAVGQNSFGTAYGTTLSFTTTNTNSSSSSGGGSGGSAVADVSTLNATAITDNKVTLEGTFYSNDLATTTWFEFSTNERDVINNNARAVGRQNQQTVAYGDFDYTVDDLTPGTTYYFRAVAENTRGISYGTIKSFTTAGTSLENSSDFSALTSLATGISFTSATLNGIIKNDRNEAIQGYFEYGTSANSLVNSTNMKSLGSNETLAMSDAVFGLAQDTFYYFRAVAESSNGISRGDIRIFKTLGGVVSTETGPVTPVTTVVASNSAFVTVSIESQSEEVASGDAINYTVRYKNTSGFDLASTAIEVTFPNEVEFNNTSDGQFDAVRNTLVVNVGTLPANVEGKITIDATVLSGANVKDFLLTNVLMKYVNPLTKGQEEAIAYVINTVTNNNRNALGAASLFGNGSFLPNTVIGWLLLVLVLSGLAFLGRYIYVGQRRKAYIETTPDNLPH